MIAMDLVLSLNSQLRKSTDKISQERNENGNSTLNTPNRKSDYSFEYEDNQNKLLWDSNTNLQQSVNESGYNSCVNQSSLILNDPDTLISSNQTNDIKTTSDAQNFESFADQDLPNIFSSKSFNQSSLNSNSNNVNLAAEGYETDAAIASIVNRNEQNSKHNLTSCFMASAIQSSSKYRLENTDTDEMSTSLSHLSNNLNEQSVMKPECYNDWGLNEPLNNSKSITKEQTAFDINEDEEMITPAKSTSYPSMCISNLLVSERNSNTDDHHVQNNPAHIYFSAFPELAYSIINSQNQVTGQNNVNNIQSSNPIIHTIESLSSDNNASCNNSLIFGQKSEISDISNSSSYWPWADNIQVQNDSESLTSLFPQSSIPSSDIRQASMMQNNFGQSSLPTECISNVYGLCTSQPFAVSNINAVHSTPVCMTTEPSTSHDYPEHHYSAFRSVSATSDEGSQQMCLSTFVGSDQQSSSCSNKMTNSLQIHSPMAFNLADYVECDSQNSNKQPLVSIWESNITPVASTSYKKYLSNSNQPNKSSDQCTLAFTRTSSLEYSDSSVSNPSFEPTHVSQAQSEFSEDDRRLAAKDMCSGKPDSDFFPFNTKRSKSQSFSTPRSKSFSSTEKISRNRPLNQNAIDLMENWYTSHWEHPYPTADEKENLALIGGITSTQVSSWFANRRTRSSNTKPKKNRRKLYRQFYELSVDIENLTQGTIRALELQERLTAIVEEYLV